MEEYAHRQNVERFRQELADERDPERRSLLERLLEDELKQLDRVRREKTRD